MSASEEILHDIHDAKSEESETATTAIIAEFKLPDDILLHIFDLMTSRGDNYVPENKNDNSPFYSDHKWRVQPPNSFRALTVSHVCQYWRRLTLSSPTLWRVIDYRHSVELRELYFCRARSGGADVSLDVYATIGRNEALEAHSAFTDSNEENETTRLFLMYAVHARFIFLKCSNEPYVGILLTRLNAMRPPHIAEVSIVLHDLPRQHDWYFREGQGKLYIASTSSGEQKGDQIVSCPLTTLFVDDSRSLCKFFLARADSLQHLSIDGAIPGFTSGDIFIMLQHTPRLAVLHMKEDIEGLRPSHRYSHNECSLHTTLKNTGRVALPHLTDLKVEGCCFRLCRALLHALDAKPRKLVIRCVAAEDDRQDNYISGWLVHPPKFSLSHPPPCFTTVSNARHVSLGFADGEFQFRALNSAPTPPPAFYTVEEPYVSTSALSGSLELDSQISLLALDTDSTGWQQPVHQYTINGTDALKEMMKVCPRLDEVESLHLWTRACEYERGPRWTSAFQGMILPRMYALRTLVLDFRDMWGDADFSALDPDQQRPAGSNGITSAVTNTNVPCPNLDHITVRYCFSHLSNCPVCYDAIPPDAVSMYRVLQRRARYGARLRELTIECKSHSMHSELAGHRKHLPKVVDEFVYVYLGEGNVGGDSGKDCIPWVDSCLDPRPEPEN